MGAYPMDERETITRPPRFSHIHASLGAPRRTARWRRCARAQLDLVPTAASQTKLSSTTSALHPPTHYFSTSKGGHKNVPNSPFKGRQRHTASAIDDYDYYFTGVYASGWTEEPLPTRKPSPIIEGCMPT